MENKSYLPFGKIFAEGFFQLNRGEQRRLMASNNPRGISEFYRCLKSVSNEDNRKFVDLGVLESLIPLLGAGLKHSDNISSVGKMLKNNPKVHVTRAEQIFASENVDELLSNLNKVIPICTNKALNFDKLYWDIKTFDVIEHRQKTLSTWAKDYWF